MSKNDTAPGFERYEDEAPQSKEMTKQEKLDWVAQLRQSVATTDDVAARLTDKEARDWISLTLKSGVGEYQPVSGPATYPINLRDQQHGTLTPGDYRCQWLVIDQHLYARLEQLANRHPDVESPGGHAMRAIELYLEANGE